MTITKPNETLTAAAIIQEWQKESELDYRTGILGYWRNDRMRKNLAKLRDNSHDMTWKEGELETLLPLIKQHAETSHKKDVITTLHALGENKTLTDQAKNAVNDMLAGYVPIQRPVKGCTYPAYTPQGYPQG